MIDSILNLNLNSVLLFALKVHPTPNTNFTGEKQHSINILFWHYNCSYNLIHWWLHLSMTYYRLIIDSQYNYWITYGCSLQAVVSFRLLIVTLKCALEMFLPLFIVIFCFPAHTSSRSVFSGVWIAWSLVFCVVFCRSLFVLFLFTTVLSVLCFTASDYHFGNFKLISCQYTKIHLG